MKKIFLCMFLILILLPISSSFAQKTDNAPTLSVVLTSNTPYVYQDEMGYTVIVGSVENKNSNTAVTNVKIRATFYDDIDVAPIEIVEGTTILEVIPPLGTSPYMIKSNSPNPKITQAGVFLETFDSSTPKSKLLTLEQSHIFYDGNLGFSGILTNGPAPVTNTNVYLALYDGFKPPRIISIYTIPIGDILPNEKTPFEFNEKINPQAVGFNMFAQSNVFYSDYIDIKIPESELLNKLVTISDVSVTDKQGNKLSEIKLGTTVNVISTSLVEFSTDNPPSEIPYIYYVQVKQAGEKPYVEYIGKFDGRFVEEGPQQQSIDWIPEKSGLYYIETFVWDRDNIPIAEQGPIVLILVN
jgi:hypothetical protein